MQRAILDNFLGIKIFGAVFVGAALAMGRFGIVQFIHTVKVLQHYWNCKMFYKNGVKSLKYVLL